MAKIEIIGPKSKFFDVVDMLHEHGKVHIEDLTRKIESKELQLDQMELVQSQDQELERKGELLIRVRAVIKALQLPGTKVDEAKRQKEYARLWQLDSAELSDEIAHVVDEVEEKTSGLAISQTGIESELSLLARYEPILQKIQPLAKQIVTTGNFDSVALLVERKYKSALDQLKDELDKITNKQCEIVSTDVDEDTTAAIIVFNKTYSEPVHKFLAIENVNQIRLPSDLQGMAFDQAYETVKERQKTLPKQLEDVSQELEGMSAKWYLRLTTIRDVLSDRIDEISAIPKFGQTDYAFVVAGWIPVVDIADLRRSLAKRFGEDVIVSQLEIDEHDFAETPVSVVNRKEVAPFEMLLNFRGGLPAYGTLDPTMILAVFYPIIFGMIVGDIGYGLVMLAFVVWLRLKFKDKPFIQVATGILGPACTMAIVWGFVYGEFFGNLVEPIWITEGWHIPLWGNLALPINRTAMDLAPLMIILSLAMGGIQVVFGLVLGIINGVKTKHMSHVYEKSGMLGFLGGLAFFGVAAVLEAGPPQTAVGVIGGIAVIGGLYYALKGGKALGLVESISLITSVASYIRIMALGLAGAIFANAVNSLAKILMGQPPTAMGIVIAIIVGLLLHTVNILVSAFSPNIHAIRLNLLEFFGKFYEPSKEPYKPFHKTGGEKSA
jgi:V/A-type H+-transporting ATPase subunit I